MTAVYLAEKPVEFTRESSTGDRLIFCQFYGEPANQCDAGHVNHLVNPAQLIEKDLALIYSLLPQDNAQKSADTNKHLANYL